MEKLEIIKLLTGRNKEIELIKAIDELGSISKAAKRVGISYKTAWNYVNNINDIFNDSLVLMRAGGKSGGGAELREEGKHALEIIEKLKHDIEKIIRSINEEDIKKTTQFLKRVSVRTSARNQFFGIVTSLKKGNIVSSVELTTNEGEKIYSLITNNSLETLYIQWGAEVYALVKAPWINVEKNYHSEISAENIIHATIIKVNSSNINHEIIMKSDKGLEITAIITDESQRKLIFERGDSAYAVFKSSNVILGV